MSREQRWRVGVATAIVAIIAASVVSPRSAFAQNVLPFVAFFLLIIPAHELGHAVAGLLVGQRIALIRLGAGPRLFAFKAWGATIELYALPLGGATLAFPRRPSRGVRLRQWIFAGGGLAANLAIYVALKRHYGAALHDDANHPFATMAASANFTIMILNAVPFRLPEGTLSDGYHLLTIPFWTRARVQRLHIVAETKGISDLVERGELARAHALAEDLRRRYPTHPSAALTLGFVLSRDRREAEARALWREAIAQTDELVTVLLLKNNIAWASAVLGDPDDLAEADRYSDEALAAAPDAVLVKGTRGAVLARLCRGGEAVPLLEAGLTAPPSASRAYTTSFLARALALEGRVDEARRALDEARALEPTCPLIPWVEADLAAGRASIEPSATAVRLPAPPDATARALALRAWRRDVRILSFAAIVLLSRAFGVGTLYPSILALFLSLAPGAGGVLALGVACAWVTLVQVGGQWHPMSVTTAPPAWAAAATFGIAAASTWLFWRHRRLEPQPRTRAPLVLAIILAVPVFSSGIVTWLSYLRDPSPLNVHSSLESLVDIGTGMVALAALWLRSDRPWVRLAAGSIVAVALVGLVGGSDYYLEHRVLARIPATGAPMTWTEQPATALRSRMISADGLHAVVSPGGRAFALIDDEDEERPPIIHVADFENHLVDVPGTNAVFIDEDHLLIVRPRIANDEEAPGVELAELRPFVTTQPVWTKAVPGMTGYVETLAVDRASGAILLSGRGANRRGVGMRTTAERDTPFEDLPGPARTIERGDWSLASFLEVNGAGELLLRQTVAPDYRTRPKPWQRRTLLHGDLWLLTSRAQTLLVPASGSMECVGATASGAPLWCLEKEGESMTPILMRIDTARATIERVPGRIPFANSTQALDATHLAMLSYELRVLDLETRRGVRMTLPELSTNAWHEHLAHGGLAVLTRVSNAAGLAKEATLTVFAMPSPEVSDR